jgi:hypothetical protein
VSDDLRQQYLRALKRELRWRVLARGRVVREIAAHVDDTVAELEAGGLDAAAAVEEALRRVGDVRTITTAFRQMRPVRQRRRLRSPAWVAVGAMSLVTAWAAELPPASGAKATTAGIAVARHHQLPRHTDSKRAGRVVRFRQIGRP